MIATAAFAAIGFLFGFLIVLELLRIREDRREARRMRGES